MPDRCRWLKALMPSAIAHQERLPLRIFGQLADGAVQFGQQGGIAGGEQQVSLAGHKFICGDIQQLAQGRLPACLELEGASAHHCGVHPAAHQALNIAPSSAASCRTTKGLANWACNTG